MQSRRSHQLSILLSAAVLAVIIVGALWPQEYLPYDPTAMSLADRLLPIMGVDRAGRLHVLGTDGIGRDNLSRMIYSSRYSLLISLAAAAITTLAAVIFGLSAGYVGGRYDTVIMRMVDAHLSLPVILVAVALAAIMGRGIVALASILAFTGWASYTRVLRGEALTLRDSGFVLAARSIGATTSHILRRSVLPNTVSTITVMTTFSIARFILIESSVSFLGMGITPPASSWGTMVGEGREYIFEAPWVSALPGLMIVITVMAINFLGDGLRDRWDPHSRTM